MPVKHEGREATAEEQVRSSIGRLEPKTQKLMRAIRAAVRRRLPAANELAYNYKHAFVIGYSPTENGIDAIVALSARPTGVFLYFNQGPTLRDPKRLLQGTAKQVRYVQLEAASQLEDPDIKAFLDATIDQARIPLPSRVKGKLIIKTKHA